MHTFFDNKFKKNVVSIGPGEYYVSEENLIIQTVLGSCIAVCLYTDYDKISGMNHFMLPGENTYENDNDYDSGRYGMYSMEMLINSLQKNGVNRKYFKAKVFGGGNVINFQNTSQKTVGENNIKFILKYLEKENIPVISNHLGGEKAKKILFFVENKKVLLKEINKSEAFDTVKEEIKYNNSLIKETKKSSSIIMFD